jgi:hypothetical protein
MDFDITPYAQQIEREALQHLTFVADEAEKRLTPVLAQPFPDNIKYRNIIDSFFKDQRFDYDVNTDISYLGSGTGGVSSRGTLNYKWMQFNNFINPPVEVDTTNAVPILQIEDATQFETLLNTIIQDIPDVAIDRIEPTFPVILMTTFPTIEEVLGTDSEKDPLKFLGEKPSTLTRRVYESSYLDALKTYVQNIFTNVGAENFRNILYSKIEKAIYDLKFAIDSEFKKTASLRFRKPNSNTLYNTREHYEKFLERLLQLSEKFVEELSAFLLQTQKLGISKENLVVDFTKHINEIKASLYSFEAEVFKTKINYLIQRYNFLSEKAALKVEIQLTELQKNLLNNKAAQLGLKVKTAQLKSKSTYIEDLLKFGSLYTDQNEAAIKKKLLDQDKGLFEELSKLHKEQSDLSVSERATRLKSKLTEVDNKVVEQKVEILNEDIEAFDKLVELDGLSLEKIKVEYDATLVDIKLKIAALNELDTVAKASAEVIKALSNSQIELTTIKG